MAGTRSACVEQGRLAVDCWHLSIVESSPFCGHSLAAITSITDECYGGGKTSSFPNRDTRTISSIHGLSATCLLVTCCISFST